jgi:anti-anti-sigma factor
MMTAVTTLDDGGEAAPLHIYITGDIDLLTATDFRDHVSNALRRSDDVVVDLSEVSFFSSAGADALASIRPRDGATVRLHRPAVAVRRVLDILGWPEHLNNSAGAVHT